MKNVWWPTGDASTVAPVEDHDDLRSAVSAVLEEVADHAAIRNASETALGYSQETWSVLTEDLGLASVSIAEEDGGLGFSLREVSVLLEETGAALLPEPVRTSAVLGARALAPLLSNESDTYSGVLDGSTVVTVWLGEGNAAGFTAQDSEGRWVLNGDAEAVPFAGSADFAVVSAFIDQGEGLFLVDLKSDEVQTEAQETLDRTSKVFRLSLKGIAATRLDEMTGTDAESFRQLRMVAIAAEHTGMIAHLLDVTKEHLLHREQFGRVLGSFQAIKHRLADVLVNLERARSASQYAAAIFDSAEPHERQLAVLIASAVCQDAVLKTAYEAIQLNGGTGFTWEHPAHYYLRRALGDEALYGSADKRLGQVSDALLA